MKKREIVMEATRNGLFNKGQAGKMVWDAWEEMGKPDAITVTIEPGDRLND